MESTPGTTHQFLKQLCLKMHSLFLFVLHLSLKTSLYSFIVMHFVIWTAQLLQLGALSLRVEKQRLKSYSTAGERERDRQTDTKHNTE